MYHALDRGNNNERTLVGTGQKVTAAAIEVYVPILVYNYFETFITGRLIEGSLVIGGRLMAVQL